MKIRGFERVKEEMRTREIPAVIPTRGSQAAAGYDFYSLEEITINPGDKHHFMTDVKAYMLPDEVLQIHVRSSMGFKRDLRLVNTTGIIDADFYSNPSNDGNIGICLKNCGTEPQKIKIGERIAQGVFMKYLLADGTDLDDAPTRQGGIGSTGK